jgi:hypothetical protein
VKLFDRFLKHETRKETQMKSYKLLAVYTLFYGSETWHVKREMKTGYRLPKSDVYEV